MQFHIVSYLKGNHDRFSSWKLRLGELTVFPPGASEYLLGLGLATSSSDFQTCDFFFSIMQISQRKNRGESQLGICPVDEVVVGASAPHQALGQYLGSVLLDQGGLSCFMAASSLRGRSWQGPDSAGLKGSSKGRLLPHPDSSEQLIIKRASKGGERKQSRGKEGRGGGRREEGTKPV